MPSSAEDVRPYGEAEIPKALRNAVEHQMAEHIRLLGLQFDINATARIRSVFMGLADHVDPYVTD